MLQILCVRHYSYTYRDVRNGEYIRIRLSTKWRPFKRSVVLGFLPSSALVEFVSATSLLRGRDRNTKVLANQATAIHYVKKNCPCMEPEDGKVWINRVRKVMYAFCS
jgi:hypothetical protein